MEEAMKFKILFLLFCSFFMQVNFAAEAQQAITTEQVTQFMEEGKKELLDWCACETFPEPNRIKFTEQLMQLYAQNYKKDEPLVITFFASGYRFLQEYTILKSLVVSGFQNITPIFIDPELKEKTGASWIPKFEEILNRYPKIQKRYYVGSSEEYLAHPNIPATDILTTIDIKFPEILEQYQNILDQKMKPHGQSACTYVDLLEKIRRKRKEEKALKEIQDAFANPCADF